MQLTIVSTAFVLSAITLAAPHNTPHFIGINESGPEFGQGNLPGTYGTDYIWPNLSSIDIFISKGYNTFRINTLMERMVSGHTMTGDLNAAYMSQLTSTINYITQRKAYAMIVPHNYGRFYHNIITSTSDFKIFWTKIATTYAHNPYVIFDTNNEYHDMSSTLVAELNQAAIDGIRAAGATAQYITVEGNAYTGAWTWTNTPGTDGKTNAQTMGSLRDPSDKIIYQMHQYLDSDGSGTSQTCVSKTIGSERLKLATNWLRANGKVGILGEFAGAVNGVCEAAVKDMLSFIAKNRDVWAGHAWWAAGVWQKDYMFSIEPADGVAYSTYVDIVARWS